MDNKQKPEKRVKDPRENKYQIGIIVSIIFMIIYGYSLYLAVGQGKTSKIYINGGIMLGWFLLCLYWLRQLGLLYKSNANKQ